MKINHSLATPMPTLKDRGFTLIELVLTMVVIAIVSTAVVLFLEGPVEGYLSQSHRTALVSEAQSALNDMQRDIHAALPNSIRVTTQNGVTALELIHVVTGARYRAGPGGSYTSDKDILQFNQSDQDFNIEGHFESPLSPTDRLVIYNVGEPGANAYSNQNVITPSGDTLTTQDLGTETRIHLSRGFQFQYQSPEQRLYVVSTPVSYLCDPTLGTLRRYSDYPIGPAQPANPTLGQPTASDVTGCRFTYVPGTPTRSALVTISITLTRHHESVHLLEQVHVDNTS